MSDLQATGASERTRTRTRGERGVWPHLLMTYPALMLIVLFVLPLLAIVVVSFLQRGSAGFFETVFSLGSYTRAFSPFYLERLAVSLGLASLAAVVCILVGFPFTYLLTRLRRSSQVPFLVLVLAVLSLSEVIVAFSWSLLLSRTSGISNLLVRMGLMDAPASWSPGWAATMLGFIFIALPLTILTFYPTVSRLDRELVEAARTMGASPARAFFTVVIPLLRQAIAGTFALVFIFILGAYVVPQTLGRPAQWTTPVHITDQAVLQSNIPLAAALAVVLLVVSLLVAGLVLFFGGRGRRSAT